MVVLQERTHKIIHSILHSLLPFYLYALLCFRITEHRPGEDPNIDLNMEDQSHGDRTIEQERDLTNEDWVREINWMKIHALI